MQRLAGSKERDTHEQRKIALHPLNCGSQGRQSDRARYIPPYPPDFSHTELSFSVLNRWVGEHFQSLKLLTRDRGDGFFHLPEARDRVGEYGTHSDL